MALGNFIYYFPIREILKTKLQSYYTSQNRSYGLKIQTDDIYETVFLHFCIFACWLVKTGRLA